MPPRFDWPGGKAFAFTIMDDTDVATVANVGPVYALLAELGMRVTKTVWPSACPEGSKNFAGSQTLEDPDYVAFIQDLQSRGFEIAFHGATMESSRRERTQRALETYRSVVGSYPRVYANHSWNRENLYWGERRIDDPILRPLYRRMNGQPPGHYQGDVEGSDYWWGDLCSAHIEYVRNLTFRGLNLLRINPTLPYRDASRPLARWWFSATDAEDAAQFAATVTPAAIARLRDEGGACIVATHLGKGFSSGGAVDPAVRRSLEAVAAAGGWFVPVGELLDWLRDHGRAGDLPPGEWRRMQWHWATDLVRRRLQGIR